MIIYKVTNLCNGKIYIGQSKTDDPEYLGSGKLICKALKKYSRTNFTKEILETVDSDDELDAREIYWISYFKKLGYSLYNIQDGGKGWSQKVLLEYWKNRNLLEKEKILSRIKEISPKPIKIQSKNLKKVNVERIKNTLSIVPSDIKTNSHSRKVYQFSIDGILLNTFQNLDHAYRSLENAKSKGSLSMACNGKRNTYGGYRWSYSEMCHALTLKKKGRPSGKKDSRHRLKKHKNSSSYTILQYDGTNVIYEWESADAIEKTLNISKQVILKVVKNGKVYKGFTWKKGTEYTKTTFSDSEEIIIKSKK